MLLLLLLMVFRANAQRGLFINDAAGGICVLKGTSVYVDGDFQLLRAFPIPTKKLINGTLTLTGDLVTNDSLYCDIGDSIPGTPPSILRFVGPNDSHIRGTITSQFYQLVINKSAGNVYIENDMKVVDTISFVSGNAIIDTGKTVHLVFRQGSNNVFSNPYLINETAQHRFTGEGFLRAEFLIEAGHEANIANTGFHFKNHQSDSMILVRGHKKQLYAGNGGIDRYFDVILFGNTEDTQDTLGLNFLHDVDYVSMGVDTANLGLYVSAQFADIDYRAIQNKRDIDGIDLSVTDTAAFTQPTVNISSKQFRITAGDTACTLTPVSSLPSSLIHLCSGDSLSVTAQNTVQYPFTNSVAYYWLADGLTAPSRYVTSTGVQQDLVVKLTDSRGCYAYDTLHIAPTAPDPTSVFGWDDACLGDSVLVHNQTTVPGGGTFTSAWNFGNGDVSASMAGTIGILYAASGSYSVTLTNTSNYGCVSSVTNIVDVFNLPVADIQTTIDCFLNTVFIDGSGSTGTTSPFVYNIINYNWDIDAGQFSETDTSFYNALSPGSHQLTLEVVSGALCRDTLTTTLIVPVRDTAGFTAQNTCVGTAVPLVNTSLIVNGNPQYQWSFGDGTTSTAANPVKAYASPGTKLIQLILQTDANCADTFFTNIVVYPNPVAGFTYSGSCIGSPITLQPASVVAGSSYSWDFGDGATTTGPIVQHTYSASGPFTATLSVQNSDGCTAGSSLAVTIHALPVASFTASSNCLGTATNYVSVSSGSGLSYAWNFGDLTTSAAGPLTQHTYATAGSHPTSLVITDVNGCSATATQNVQVYALPQATLGNLATCGNSYVLDAGNPGSTYLWSPSNASTQTITVMQSGSSSVTITDVHGCQSVANATVTLNSIVQPQLGADTSVCGELILAAGYAGADYLWQDGSTGPTFQATTAGLYWVEVTDQNNCVGRDSINILNVYPFAIPDLGADMTVCSGSFPVSLTPGSYSSYSWNDGSTNSTLAVNSAGIITVTVTDGSGCTGFDTIAITALSTPVSALNGTEEGCDEALLIASPDPSYDYNWNTGETTQFITVSTSGNYSVIVTDNISGCQLHDTVAVTILQSPVVSLGPDLSVCSNSPVTLNAFNAGASYEWTSSSNALLGTGATYTPISSGAYLVTVSSGSCVASDAINITLLPSPVIPVQSAVFYICGETAVNLNGCSFSANDWTGPDGFTSTDPTIAAFITGNYSVLAHVGSCTTTRNFELVTSPNQLQAFYLVDSDTTKNLALQFIDLSDPAPISYLWDFGDGTSDTVANPVHQYSNVNVYHTSLTVSNGTCISRYDKEINQKFFNPGGTPQTSAPNLELLNSVLYPNPAVTEVYFEAFLSDAANSTIVLYDILGKVLYTEQITESDEIQLSIPVNTLQTGSYYVRLTAESLKGNVIRNYKLIKSN